MNRKQILTRADLRSYLRSRKLGAESEASLETSVPYSPSTTSNPKAVLLLFSSNGAEHSEQTKSSAGEFGAARSSPFAPHAMHGSSLETQSSLTTRAI